MNGASTTTRKIGEPARKIFAKTRRLRGVGASDDDGKLPNATKTVTLRAGKVVRAALS